MSNSDSDNKPSQSSMFEEEGMDAFLSRFDDEEDTDDEEEEDEEDYEDEEDEDEE